MIVKVILWLAIISIVCSNITVYVTSDDLIRTYAKMWTRIIIVLLPIPCYIFIYFGIRRHYQYVISTNLAFLSSSDIQQLHKAVRTTLFFFIAMMQYNVIRAMNSYLYVF